jgi:nicotinamidase-related amidase
MLFVSLTEMFLGEQVTTGKTTLEKRKPGQFTQEYILSKAKRDYENGQASIRINPKKTALIVVDMQEEFTRSNWSPNWIPEATKQVPKIKDLIAACRRLRIPIIYTYFAFRPDGMNMAPPLRAGWTPLDKYDDYDGPPLYQKENIDQALKPDYETDILVSKPCLGAFTGTSLDLILKNLGVDTIVICGTMTNYCCGTTAREAHARGYKVVFGSDVNSTDNPEVHDAELKTLRRGFALVLAKDQIKEALEGKGPYAWTDKTTV